MKEIVMTFTNEADYNRFLNMTLEAFEGKEENTVIDDGTSIRVHISNLD